MALYAIGDLHLCLGADKPMDVFGGAWVGYMEKLREGLKVIGPEDTTVLLGDLSWALDLEQAHEDFAFIDQIPGRKIILKGNHDYWWSTASKFYKFCQKHGFEDQWILNNNHYAYEGFAICGKDGKYFWADKAEIRGDKVVVSSSKVTEPAGVRYAWQQNPTCNLYNKANFPAVPFSFVLPDVK